MDNLTKITLLEKYIAENGAKPKFTVPFLKRKNTYNVELQNWKDYQDLRKGIITIRQSGIRVKSPDYHPCLTHSPVNIPIIYENGYRYLNKKELANLQSFNQDYQFPIKYSLNKIASLLGNSANVEVIKYFAEKNLGKNFNLPYVDLFCGIGAFSQALGDKCQLAVDNNKSCAETYQLNFPNTPFLLGDINQKEIQKRIIETDFDLLCAGFPCQPYSKANTSKNKKDTVINSLLAIIEKKRPQYLFLENVPQLVKYPIWTEMKEKLSNWGYQIYLEKLCPTSFGIPMKRSRIFIWGQKIISK